ncbi:putative g-protein coupled receptor fragment [Schistosoma mansoni]|uniref:putative g-protein coupled receptor fragment n=1 Tax=Schistosoma mansoni TaxID=6183 RepID=UPI0001A64615|nr:putative g-protein coupled receptor fragment [Schistosoma mansoni]
MSNPKGCLIHLTKEEIMVYTFRAYVSPILVIIGIPSNLLVILVFIIIEYQTNCRFNLYAIWMAIAHNIQLIVNTLIDDFLGRGLKYATQCKYSIQVDIESSLLCKLFTYLTDASALIAAFILMLFSVDRVCSIYKPKQFEQSSHVKLAHIIITIVIIICLILNIPHLIFADLKIHSINKLNESFMPTFRQTLMDIFKCRIFLRNDHLKQKKKYTQDNHIEEKGEQQCLHQSEQQINISVMDQETISLYSNKLIRVEDFYIHSNSLNCSTDPIPFIDQYTNYSPEHYTMTML